MKLTHWITPFAFAGAMASAPLFAQGMSDQQGMSGQEGGMSSDMQAQQGMPAANQQASADAIRMLQKSLNEKGHNAGSEDGVWGPKTEAALRDFQQSSGLVASGNIDAETLTALGIDSSEFAAFGIKEEAPRQERPGATDQGTSGMPESGGAPPSGGTGMQGGGGGAGGGSMPESSTP